MVKYLRDASIDCKTVIVRVDYNVTIKDGKILSYKKIDDSLETINYLLEKNCKIILLSHFGRVKSENDKVSNSLKPVYEYLKNEKKYNILFSEEVIGLNLEHLVSSLASKQILLVENTRYADLLGNLESGNDVQLSLFWASLADYYVTDAFASLHRDHASVSGIPKYLPSAVGFLVEKELSHLEELISNPEKPFVIIMGGAKLEDKIELIYSLIEKCDYILFGGGIANTFLYAAGYDVGASLFSPEMVPKAKSLLREFPDKIILPKDVIVSPSFDNTFVLRSIENVMIDDVIGDIGSGAIANYAKFINQAKTIFVNGTVGKYEDAPFSNGTSEILRIITESKAKTIIGGGDAASSIERYNLQDKVYFVSTGGGATLHYIANGELHGLKNIGTVNENSNN